MQSWGSKMQFGLLICSIWFWLASFGSVWVLINFVWFYLGWCGYNLYGTHYGMDEELCLRQQPSKISSFIFILILLYVFLSSFADNKENKFLELKKYCLCKLDLKLQVFGIIVPMTTIIPNNPHYHMNLIRRWNRIWIKWPKKNNQLSIAE